MYDTRVWVALKWEWTVKPYGGEEPLPQALPEAELSFIFQFSVTLLKTRMPRCKSVGLTCTVCSPLSQWVCMYACAHASAWIPPKSQCTDILSSQKKPGNTPSKGRGKGCQKGKNNHLYYQDAIYIRIYVWNKDKSSGLNTSLNDDREGIIIK